MNISFIGCPGSGKTTLAFKLYAALKEEGISCDFLQEQARLYIAELREAQALEPHEVPELTDRDQRQIMLKQMEWERIMSRAIGPTGLLVTDSSPLNSLLYMTPATRSEMQSVTNSLKTVGNLIFYCAPVSIPDVADPNRIHTAEQSQKVDESIMPILAQHVPIVLNTMIYLEGSLDYRFQTLLQTVLGAIT